MMVRYVRCLLLVASAFPVCAQESLDVTLDRGYVAQWLVCGPFAPDVEGGIVAAVKRGAAPLGGTDFMAPAGGVARLRPTDQLTVQTDDGAVPWRTIRGEEPCIDLASLFTGQQEGVAYAAFYVDARERQQVYLDAQTPLGARIYLNGFPVREVQAAPAQAAGLDRFVATAREGRNLVVMEVPLATLDALAEAMGMTGMSLRAAGFPNRPLLHGLSGYEIGLRIQPAAEFAGVVYVPRLRSTGALSGFGDDVRQDAVLTLFNPSSAPTQPLMVEAFVAHGEKPIRQVISPIAPGAEQQAIISIPIGEALSGQTVTVEVTLQRDGETVQFNATVNALARTDRGAVYVVTGRRYGPPQCEDQASEMARCLGEFSRDLLVLDSDPKYGFDLGGAAYWKPALDVNPRAREVVRQAVGTLRCGTHAGFCAPDERIVGGEILVRNLTYGAAAVTSLLDDEATCYYAWDAPAVCPQTPQLLSDAGILGLVSNLPVGGLPEIFWHEAPDGTRLIHRHKRSGPGPRSLDELRETAALQRRELAERGLESDILVIASAVPPPEPFFLGACSALARAMPRIVVSGGGGRTFMEDTLSALRSDLVDIPVTARAMGGTQPGCLVAQPDLKRAHGEVENLLLAAEKFATFAALLGAKYPESSLDLAWRQLLYTSAPDRVGFAGRPRVYADALASLREAADFAGGVLQEAMAYIAGQADTISTVPPDSESAGLGSLVVFNPCSWGRTDLCRTTLAFAQGVAGLALLNDAGGAVPFLADQIERANGRIVRATIRFVARDVPALGYRTYYLRPQGALPEPSVGPGAQIENEYFRLLVDPLTGGIAHLTAKDTESKFARGLLNAVVGIEEDGAKNAHGRDLWTTGEVTRVGPGTAGLTQTKTDWMQQLTITIPFAEGAVVRQLTLYAGIPRVDCEIRFDGVRTADRLLAVTFELDGKGRAPVFGERFGAVVGRKSRGVLDFRTAGADNVSGTGVQPALRWTALSPNDHADVGGDAVVPFGPCAVVHGEDSQLVRAAREIQTALAMRGIPAATWPDVTRALNPVWTDSTEYPNFNDDLDYGTAMRIVVGSQEQNVFARHLCLVQLA